MEGTGEHFEHKSKRRNFCLDSITIQISMATPLQERIITLERELAETREQLRYLSSSLLNQDSDPLSLRSDEYRRYGRQMILDGFGLPCVFHFVLCGPNCGAQG